MIGFYKKLKIRFYRWLFLRQVRKNEFFNDVFYTKWREDNQCLNKSFKEVLNDKTRK